MCKERGMRSRKAACDHSLITFSHGHTSKDTEAKRIRIEDEAGRRGLE
jgi:hypothetical protein